MEIRLPAGVLKGRFTSLLSEQIRPFLKDRGFGKSGPTFARRRGRLYDVVNFQGSDANGIGTLHRFYVNVGIGSVDVDGDLSDGTAPPRPRLDDCLVSRRWGEIVDGAPSRVEIRPDTDLDALWADLRRWLVDVVTFLDAVGSTDDLIDLAIARNRLMRMEKTCAYLSHTDDAERLLTYVRTLREHFGADARWPIFNRQITEATGPSADILRGAGLLDDYR